MKGSENMNELEAYELSELDNISNLSEEDKKRFKVTSAATANWVFRKIKYINLKMDEVNSLANEDINRINSWREQSIKQYEDLKEYFEGLIKEHIFEQRKVDKDYKISTPYGKAYIRTSPEKWEYNEEVLIKWLKNNNNKELINVKETVDKNNLKKIAAAVKNEVVDINSGEIIEGITVKDGEKQVIITINK